MLKILFKIIVKIRGLLNPLVLPKDTDKWIYYENLSLNDFSAAINSYPYMSDELFGILDKTETFEHFIDTCIKSGRDCDDYARMWSLWGIYNGYTAHEYVVTTEDHPFTNSHVITILEKDGKFKLCNYKPYPNRLSIEAALDLIKMSKTYKDGYIYSHQSTFNPIDLV